MSAQPYHLKAERAFWDHPSAGDVSKLSNAELLALVKELDRRFIQLWDKVVFEREHGLVNYENLNTQG